LGEDDDNLYYIEVKNSPACKEHVKQVRRYMDLHSDNKKGVVGILVAKYANKSSLEYAKELGVIIKEVSKKPIKPSCGLKFALKELLESLNVSVEQLIKLTNLPKVTVATLASGLQPTRVELATIYKICIALDCNTNDILKLVNR